MGGRILGVLLLCDPPEQSLAELEHHLQASAGSVSTMTRLLEQTGLIERVAKPGDRRFLYRVRPHAMDMHWEQQLDNAKALHALVERSLDAMGKRSKKRRDRLEVVGEYADFYVEKLPGLIDEWRKRSKSL